MHIIPKCQTPPGLPASLLEIDSSFLSESSKVLGFSRIVFSGFRSTEGHFLLDARPAAGGGTGVVQPRGSSENRDAPGPGGCEKHLQPPPPRPVPRVLGGPETQPAPPLPPAPPAGRRGARCGGFSVTLTRRF